MNILAHSLQHKNLDEMTWNEAMQFVQHAVQNECNRLQNDYEYYRDAPNTDPDFNNGYAAQCSLDKIDCLRQAFVVLTRGY